MSYPDEDDDEDCDDWDDQWDDDDFEEWTSDLYQTDMKPGALYQFNRKLSKRAKVSNIRWRRFMDHERRKYGRHSLERAPF